jgi:phosphoglycerate kinase
MLKEAAKLALESKIVLPGDVVVARGKNIKTAMVKGPKEIQDKEAIFDIGPGTIREFSSYIRKAQTIIWNGPMGYFEVPTFSHGSVALGRLIASRSKGKAFGVVGGGETLVCLQKTGMAEFVDHISTGGGAMLEFLAGEKLPGIEALG